MDKLTPQEKKCIREAIDLAKHLTDSYTRTPEGNKGQQNDHMQASNTMIGMIAFDNYKDCLRKKPPSALR